MPTGFLPILPSVLVVGQATMLVILLAADPRERPAHRWLILLLVGLGLTAFDDVVADTSLGAFLAPVAPLTAAGMFMVGPALLGYARSATKHGAAAHLGAEHFIPAIVAAALVLLDFLVLLHVRRPAAPTRTAIVTQWVAALQPAIYFVAVFRLIRRTQRALRDEVSTLEGRTLDWLLLVTALFSLVLVAWVATAGLGRIVSNAIASALIFVALVVLGARGIRQRHVRTGLDPWPHAPVPREETGVAVADGAKYARSAIPLDVARRLRDRLEAVMRQDRPFLSMDLTLGDLACRLDASPHQLSQVFSQHVGETFYDYVNRHRVEVVKAMLADPRLAQRTLLEIALSAGFGSKSTFNSTFRRLTGISPSAYRLRHLPERHVA